MTFRYNLRIIPLLGSGSLYARNVDAIAAVLRPRSDCRGFFLVAGFFFSGLLHGYLLEWPTCAYHINVLLATSFVVLSRWQPLLLIYRGYKLSDFCATAAYPQMSINMQWPSAVVADRMTIRDENFLSPHCPQR